MNKNIKIIFNIISVVICLIVFCICLFLLLNKLKTSMMIFYNSINSIVELKTETEGNGENFGTASFVSKDGKLITATHVVTYKRLDKIKEYEKYFIRFSNDTKYRKVKTNNWKFRLVTDYKNYLTVIPFGKPGCFYSRELKELKIIIFFHHIELIGMMFHFLRFGNCYYGNKKN